MDRLINASGEEYWARLASPELDLLSASTTGKSPLQIMAPHETCILQAVHVPTSPSNGPPLLSDSTVPDTPPVMTPLRRYLRESARHERIVTGLSPVSSDAEDEDEGDTRLAQWIIDVSIPPLALANNPSKSASTPASGWSGAEAPDGSCPTNEADSPEPDPLHLFLMERRPSERLAYQLQSQDDRPRTPPATTNRTGPPPPRPPARRTFAGPVATAASPRSGSSISVDSAIDQTMSEQAIKFGSLNRALSSVGFGTLDFPR